MENFRDLDLTQRLEFIIQYKRLTLSAFAFTIKRTRQEISNWLKNDPTIPQRHLITILEAHKDIDANWLIRGDSEPIRKGFDINQREYEQALYEVSQHPTKPRTQRSKNSEDNVDKLTNTVENQSETIIRLTKYITDRNL